MADVWAPLQYGWGHVYWLTIEGVPYVWSQSTTSKTLPSGYASEEATLVVGSSARVGAVLDRDKGIGAGFPLTFTLLDSPTLAGLMTRPTAQTALTSDLTSSGGTISVADTSDFAASGTVYIGKETIEYSSKAASSFTVAGSGRGKAGYAYPHSAKSAAALVTDAPRYWRGRFVTLYASPVDPTGYVTGSALDNDAVAIWRGYLDTEPKRSGDGDGFVFEALPLDRMLARKLSAGLTGVVQDTDLRFELQSDKCAILLELYDSAGAHIGGSPYNITWDAMPTASAGDFVSVTEFNASAISTFATAITTFGAGAYINGIDIIQATSTALQGASVAVNKGDWTPILRLAANASVRAVVRQAVWCGNVAVPADALSANKSIAKPFGVVANEAIFLDVAYSWSPYALTATGGKAVPSKPNAAIRFDQGHPGTLPDYGHLEIGGDAWLYNGVEQTADAAVIVFRNLLSTGASSDLSSLVGADARVVMHDTGNLADVCRRMLHSSGESGLRNATYDTLPGQIGYGLPDDFVDDDAVGEVLGEGWLSDIALEVGADGESLSGTLGGLLALSQRALVVTDDGSSDATMTAVHTSAGAGGYAASMTDDQVLAHPAARVTLGEVAAPNMIASEIGVGDIVTANVVQKDASRIAFEGEQGLSFSIPSTNKQNLVPKVAGWSLARIGGDQHAAVLTVDVVPWLGVRIGDSVDVTITHPAVWSWVGGASGYTGRARCVGREIQLSTAQQRLHLLIAGASVGTALCPAAPVLAFTGLATAPTTIDVGAGFYTEIQRALTAEGGDIPLLVYEPGQGSEGTGEGYTISAAQIVAAVCRLTVATVVGTPTLSTTTSYLTWPETATAVDYQETFAHAGAGQVWV